MADTKESLNRKAGGRQLKKGSASKISKKQKKGSREEDSVGDGDLDKKPSAIRSVQDPPGKLKAGDEDGLSRPQSEPLSPKLSANMDEYAGEGDEDFYPMPSVGLSKIASDSNANYPRSGKPQVWIKIRPSPDVQDSLFELTPDRKGIRILPNYVDQFDPRGRSRPTRVRGEQVFCCDGVIGNASQDETYCILAQDVVDKAMEGISGIIVSVGPEVSGKHFTLFGCIDKFQYRGIIPRCIERMFQICDEKANQVRYLIRMAIVEVRNDKIRDLLTLGSYEGSQFDRDAPNGMVFQKIGTADHGLGLLIRALTCQKEIPRESYAKPHTVVFIDIYGEMQSENDPSSSPYVIKSRITFAKTAGIPERDILFPPPSTACTSYLDSYGCVTSNRPATAPPNQNPSSSSQTNCGRYSCTKSKTGPLAEAIRIRQDLGFLEQMCSKAAEYQKLNQYYEKLVKMGLDFPPLPPRSQHYRLSKLTYCLKEIVSGNSEIRILLHIRPERRYQHATLEAMRFAEKIRNVPNGLCAQNQANKTSEAGIAFSEDFNLVHFLSKMPPEVLNLYIHVQPGTFKTVRDHAAALIDSKIHPIAEESGEDHIPLVFEKFRTLWLSLMQTGTLPTVLSSGSVRKLDFQDPSEEEVEQRLRRISSQDKKKEQQSDLSKAVVIAAEEETEQVSVPSSSVSAKKSHRISRGKTLLHQQSHNTSAHPSKQRIKRRTSRKIAEQEESKSGKIHEAMQDDVGEVEEGLLGQALLEEAGEDEQDHPPAATDVNLPQSEVPTKEEALNEFLTTPPGGEAFQELQKKTEELKKLASEHNDAIRDMSLTISRLNAFHTELNVMQQERFLNGAEYDASGEIVVGPHEKTIIQEMKLLEKTHEEQVTRMNQRRLKVYTQKQEVDAAKLELDTAFLNYAKEAYGVTYTETGLWEKLIDEKSSADKTKMDDDEERIKKYEVIKKVAKKQARLFLKAVKRKPLWVPY